MSRQDYVYRFCMIFCLTLLLSASCSVRRSEPITGPMNLTEEALKNGEKQYMTYCQKCHPIGESGLGPALNINPAPKFAKRFQVRHGLGVMPSFSKEVISDDDLDDILAYISVLKKNK